MTNTTIPNEPRVAPNGRAYDSDATMIWSCELLELFMLVLTETPNSCTRAIYELDSEESLGRGWGERGRLTPADAKARLVHTYARKVRSDARWSRATEPVFRRMSGSLNVCGVLDGAVAGTGVPSAFG